MTLVVRALAVVIALLCSAALADAQQKFDPNAPGQKVITVGSEIKRGAVTVFIAVRAVDYRDVLAVAGVIERVVEQNQLQNTDTDGFLLGAYFGGWYALIKSLDSDVTGGKDLDKKREGVRAYFVVYRSMQRRMGIDDATLCDVTGVSLERIKPEIETWSKK